MQTRWKSIISILVLLFLIAACGNETSEVSKNDETTTSQTAEDSGAWDILLVPVSEEYESAAPVCDMPDGDFRLCEFDLEVTNVSKLPQTLEGIYFLETANGTIFQESKRYFESFTGVVNPGETVLQTAKFSLPIKGEVAFRMYRAWNATGDAVFSHTFETMWDLAYD